MKRPVSNNTRVLAIDPYSRGFGFVVMEGKDEVIDWGLKIWRLEAGDRNAWCLKHAGRLIDLYQPGVIVLENTQGKSSRRGLRVQALIKAMLAVALEHKIRIRKFAPSDIRSAFASVGTPTKHQIALEIARRLPELAVRTPRNRKPWMSEDARMSIFDAAALALAYFRPK